MSDIALAEPPALAQDCEATHEQVLHELLHAGEPGAPTAAAVCECLRYATQNSQFKWLKMNLPPLLSVDLSIRTLRQISLPGTAKNKGQMQQWCVLLLDYFAKSRAAVPDTDDGDSATCDSKEEEETTDVDDEPFDSTVAPLSDPALIDLCHAMNSALPCGTWCRLIGLFRVPYSTSQRQQFVRRLLEGSKFKDAVICAVRLGVSDFFSVRYLGFIFMFQHASPLSRECVHVYCVTRSLIALCWSSLPRWMNCASLW
jgi:hypothetical protein